MFTKNHEAILCNAGGLTPSGCVGYIIIFRVLCSLGHCIDIVSSDRLFSSSEP